MKTHARSGLAALLLLSCAGAKAPDRARSVANAASDAGSDSEVSSSDGEAEEAGEPDGSSSPEEPALPEVTFEPAEPSAAPSKMPSVAITSPRKGAVIPVAAASDQEIKLDVKGWDLHDGNHVQLLFDNRPYLRVDNLKTVIKLKDLAPPAALEPGQHFVAALLARGNLETVKPAGRAVPAAVVTFFIGKKVAPVWKEGSPILVYSSPQNGPAPDGGLLVDFYVLNADIAKGKTVVHASVSGPGLRAAESLTKWTPWRVKNPRPGLYAIQVALFRYEASDLESGALTGVTYKTAPVPGPWSSITREFTIRPAAKK